MLSIARRHSLSCLCSALFAVTFAVPALAQRFQLGLEAGVPMTEYFRAGFLPFPGGGGAQYSAGTRRYTVGLSTEWHLYDGLGFEVGVLYKRMGYAYNENSFSSSSGVQSTIVYDVKGSSWDFPIMMKYRFGRSRRPYVSGGYVVRHIGPVRARGVSTESDPFPTRHTVITQIDTGQPGECNFAGLTVGAGFEFGGRRLRFFPELRYTHWVSNFETTGDALRLNPDQAEFLLGFVFLRR